VNITVNYVSVDSGIIIITDVDAVERNLDTETIAEHVFSVPIGDYKVEYVIPESWNGRCKGEGLLKVRTGKIVISDPCYIIESEQKHWEDWLRQVYINWDTSNGITLNKLFLEDKGQIIIDTMGGDGEYTVHLTLINKDELRRQKPKVKLIGQDGNVFNLAGIVHHALEKAGQKDKAKEFTEKLPKCHSYDEALMLMLEYVDEEGDDEDYEEEDE
jgi:hypothetical protein